MPPASTLDEPTAASFAFGFQRYLYAMRPGFLQVSLVPVLLGWATSFSEGSAFDFGTALVTVFGALSFGGAVNVVNDYYDALSGGDAINDQRVFPFTGGSRSIQNGILTLEQMWRWGLGLMILTGLLGLWLMWLVGPALAWLGLAGFFLGWSYSAPPLSLAARGLGELAVALGFGLCIPLGADFVQRGDWSWSPVLFAVPYALQVAAILYANEFPDATADATVGKRTLVVRLGVRASWGYVLLTLVASCWFVGLLLSGALPWKSALAGVPLVLNWMAARDLLRLHPPYPSLIRLTILAAVAHGALLALSLFF